MKISRKRKAFIRELSNFYAVRKSLEITLLLTSCLAELGIFYYYWAICRIMIAFLLI